MGAGADRLPRANDRARPLALAATKRAVNIGAEMDIERGIAYVLQEFALLFAGSDQKEGMAAFLERREPEFDGR